MKRSSAVTITAVILVLLWTLTPLYWFGRLAFEHSADMTAFPSHFFPKRIKITGFVNILGFSYISKSGTVFSPLGMADQIKSGLLNSFILSVIVTLITMTVVVPPVEHLARINRYSRLGIFFRIIIPMGRVGIAVGAVISFLFTWNEYTFSQILSTGSFATTIAASISRLGPGHLAAAVIYSLVPPFIVVFLLQKHISKMYMAEPLGWNVLVKKKFLIFEKNDIKSIEDIKEETP